MFSASIRSRAEIGALMRIAASAWERALSLSSPTIVAIPRPVRLKLSTNSKSADAVVWSISVTRSVICRQTPLTVLGTRANCESRCKKLKQTIGRPKYM